MKIQWSQETLKHLDEHLKDWPMTGSEVLAACQNWSDVPEEDREMAEKMIDREKVYNNLDALKADLMEEQKVTS